MASTMIYTERMTFILIHAKYITTYCLLVWGLDWLRIGPMRLFTDYPVPSLDTACSFRGAPLFTGTQMPFPDDILPRDPSVRRIPGSTSVDNLSRGALLAHI